MSEQQADYHTDDTQPTPGPWKVEEDGLTIVTLATYEPDGLPARIADANRFYLGEEEAKTNAELIAAAGTAASELPEEYDPVTAIQALPVLVRALETLQGSVDLTGDDFAEELGKMGVIQSALDAARQHTTQTDE